MCILEVSKISRFSSPTLNYLRDYWKKLHLNQFSKLLSMKIQNERNEPSSIITGDTRLEYN
jgi:hypothetical protein